jgi:hypothetical protein
MGLQALHTGCGVATPWSQTSTAVSRCRVLLVGASTKGVAGKTVPCARVHSLLVCMGGRTRCMCCAQT